MPTSPVPPLVWTDEQIWLISANDPWKRNSEIMAATLRKKRDEYEADRATAATRIATLEAKLRIAETALVEYANQAERDNAIIDMYEKG